MADNRITREEIQNWFGPSLPVEAAILLWEPPKGITTDQLREELKAMAARHNASLGNDQEKE